MSPARWRSTSPMKRKVRCSWSSDCQRAPLIPPIGGEKALADGSGRSDRHEQAVHRPCLAACVPKIIVNRPRLPPPAVRFSLKWTSIGPIFRFTRHFAGDGRRLTWLTGLIRNSAPRRVAPRPRRAWRSMQASGPTCFRVYNYMTSAILLTGIVAVLIGNTNAVNSLVVLQCAVQHDQPERARLDRDVRAARRSCCG